MMQLFVGFLLRYATHLSSRPLLSQILYDVVCSPAHLFLHPFQELHRSVLLSRGTEIGAT